MFCLSYIFCFYHFFFCSSNAFMANMRLIYNEVLRRPSSFRENSHKTPMQAKLRRAIDLCKDKLPSLLKIDSSFGMTVIQLLENPQLRSLTPLSEKSLINNHDDPLSPSISYCLLKVYINTLFSQLTSTWLCFRAWFFSCHSILCSRMSLRFISSNVNSIQILSNCIVAVFLAIDFCIICYVAE